MKIQSLKLIFALLFSVLLLGGCSSDPVVDESVNAAGQEAGGSETYGAPSDADISAQQLAEQKAREIELKEQSALREVRTFYFDFDQISVKSDAQAALTAHAKFLAMNPSTKVVLEGHCDERGTKEYNIALGEGRAKAIARFLIVNGVSSAQIETISYGEERPADSGHDESAWAKNRRVYVEYK